MVAVGELFLSAFIQMLVQQLLYPELVKFASREGIGQKLHKWKKTLSRIQAVLDDAEDRQDNNDREVKQWLDNLQDLAYDVDDILDEFNTEVLRSKTMGENRASTSKVRNLIPACCTGLTPSAVKMNIRLGPKIKEITDRFNKIVKQKDDLNLREKVDGRRPNRERERLRPTSVMNEARIYGREKDKENVLELLLTENFSAVGVGVVSIVGMGGMGKTTLAQLVYNDEKLKGIFGVKAWVCVSDDFDVVRVTKAVLKSVGTSENCEGQALDWLQVQLKEKLQGKKFLLVMDDVWNEDHYEDWAKLRVPFDAAAPGSKILVTTRSKGVSSLMGTVDGPVYDLQLLSDDVCLSILSLHAFDARDFAFPDLRDIGEDIAKKCKGSPLAATTIGGLLRSKPRCRDKWEEVLSSRIWDATEEGSKGIVPALKLSYHHLPSHLKRCFAYCSIFPKDYEFEVQKLVLLWMAEGFIIEREEGGKKMEDFGGEYFSDLVSRSFFQQSSNDESRFLMHDLINDLAQSVAGDTCFREEGKLERSNNCGILKKARHWSYLADVYDDINKFEAFSDGTHLRTFISLRFVRRRDCFLTRYVTYKLLPKLQCLRVLTLSGYMNMFELPDSIGVLKHLRYVDLSYTSIESLPESMTTLCNLQTLLLEACEALKKLPSKFEKLVNLRHLNIKGAWSLEGMPPGMGKLTCLQTLSDFVVGEGSCSGIQELGPLSHLRGTLRISKLENEIDIGDANLIGKSKLDRLVLEWSPDLDESQNKRSDEFESVLNKLRPNNSLKEFTIENCGGTKFPTWLGDPSFSNMVLLSIGNCRSCTSLPPVGQLASLKDLFISGMAAVKNVGPEFYGESCSQPFKSLEKLFFYDMKECEHWILRGRSFPCLHYLHIWSCPRLVSLLAEEVEEQLPYTVKKITISYCEMLQSLPKSMMHNNTCLESIELKGCDSLTHFARGQLPPTLKSLEISSCNRLRILLDGDDDINSYGSTSLLESLHIERCGSLKCLTLSGELPATLKIVWIDDCGQLESAAKRFPHNSLLESLIIGGCESLKCLTLGGELPATLKQLSIGHCGQLESVAKRFPHNSLLEKINIWVCDKLKSLPMGLDSLAHLNQISVDGCPNLVLFQDGESLPANLEELALIERHQGLPNSIHNLTSLRKLTIKRCPGLLFPEEGFPPNLTSLVIHDFDLNFIEALFVWGLPNLTSLKELDLTGGSLHLTSFPEMMLPAFLTQLFISDFPNLEFLSFKGFQNLASLENLTIWNCEKLASLPKDGLPPTILSLLICNCPLLKARCKKGGQEWSKIAHIPRVEFDDEIKFF